MHMRSYSRLMVLLTLAFLPTPANAQNPIWFGSDVHCNYNDHTAGANRGWYNLNDLLKNVITYYGSDFLGLCGDQVRKSSNPEDPLKNKDYVDLYTLIGNYGVTFGASKGNHDLVWNSKHWSTTNMDSGFNYTPTPFADVYVISSDDFPYISYDLSSYLDAQWTKSNEQRDGRIIVIMSHFPLHTLKPDVDQGAANEIFTIIDYYTNPDWIERPLDVIYLWGHTHDGDWDKNIKMIAKPSQQDGPRIERKMLEGDDDGNFLPSIHHPNTKRLVWFTYANAGYVSIPGNSSYQGNVTAVWTGYDYRDGYVVARFPGNGANHQMSTEETVPRLDPARYNWGND